MRKEGRKEEENRTRIEKKEEGRKGRKKDTKKKDRRKSEGDRFKGKD